MLYLPMANTLPPTPLYYLPCTYLLSTQTSSRTTMLLGLMERDGISIRDSAKVGHPSYLTRTHPIDAYTTQVTYASDI